MATREEYMEAQGKIKAPLQRHLNSSCLTTSLDWLSLACSSTAAEYPFLVFRADHSLVEAIAALCEASLLVDNGVASDWANCSWQKAELKMADAVSLERGSYCRS
eukprot:scaffold92267_cov34-Tisochrysis_lutea.AAC.2